ETSRQKLKPALLKALQGAAQAEKDWKFAIKKSSFTPILLAMGITFFIGMFLQSTSLSGAMHLTENVEMTDRREAPPTVSSSKSEETPLLSEDKYAVSLYNQGIALSQKENFEFAVTFLSKAVESDRGFSRAYEALGYALYRLGRYDEAVEKLYTAVGLRKDFG